MRIFLAGASGAIGRRLTPLLVGAGHHVNGITRTAAKIPALEAAGITATVADVFNADILKRAVIDSAPEVIIHQLTDLPAVLDETQLAESYSRNARIRIEGTRNLIAAAQAASARRFIVQSIAFGYAPGNEPHSESDPLDIAQGPRAVTVRGAADMEKQVLTSGLDAIILRYAFFYGPGTWHDDPVRKPAVHIDAAAQVTFQAVTRGRPGIYNVADNDEIVSTAKARAELGFDPAFRLSLRA